MEYLALYRRYRPNTFDKLIGQDGVVKTLKNQIESGRIGHAYLFTGTRGTGKTSAAKIFAKAVNCLNPINGSPCGNCECCKSLSDPSNIDVIEIDAASNNGVNEIRDLREKAQYPPVSCKYKVYIIDEVHMLSGAAFNALLKTLEEPPKHVIFILATTEVQKIPATILSRCMRFDFKLISTDKIAALISSIYDEVGKKYETSAVNAIAAAGEGSIRDALSIADIALSAGKDVLTYDDVTEILGSTKKESIFNLIDAILSADAGKIIDITEELSKLGKSVGVLIKDIVKTLRNLLVVSTCSSPNDILNLPDDVFNSLKALSTKTDKDSLIRIMEIFAEAENSLRYSTQPRTVFEVAAIKAAKPYSDFTPDAFISRINKLERELAELQNTGFIQSVNKNNDNILDVSDNSIGVNKDNDLVKTYNLRDFENLDSELKGKILTGLRRAGHEMLWNIMQNIGVNAVGNILILSVKTEADIPLIDRADNIGFIKDALADFNPFEVQVKVSSQGQKSEKLDSAAESVKKIFGDNIVIVKN